VADSEVKVIISGNSGSAVSAMGQASTAVKESVAQMKESLASVKESFEGLHAGILAIGALFAGGIFKEVVKSTQEWTENAIDLGLQLGITTQQASAYAVAIKEVGGSTDDFAGASRGLTRQLKTHEKALNDMGIITRDTNGALLDANTIMFNAIDTVNEYAAGTDRNLAAQTAFGRGVSASSPILRLHRDEMEEAAATAERLGLVVGGNAREAFERQRKAMADVNLVGQSMSNQIGQALIPVLLSLAQAFSGQASSMASAFGQVIVWVAQAVLGLWYGLKELGTMLGGVGAAIGALAHRDFAGFKEILKQTREDLKAMSDEGDAAIKKLGASMAAGAQAAASGGAGDPAGGNKSFKLNAKKEKGPDNRLAELKNSLELQEQAQGDFDRKDLSMQMAFWQQALSVTTGGTKEDAKLRAEINKEILSLNKKEHDEEVKAEEEYLKTVQALALGEIAAKQTALQQDFAMGKITNAQEIQGEIALANEKLAIEKKELEDKMKLMQFDALGQQKIRDQELILTQKHDAEVQKLVNKSALAQQKVWSDLFKNMQTGFAQTIAAFLQGTTTIGSAIKSLFNDITSSIINSLAQAAAKNAEVMLESIVLNRTAAMAEIKANAAKGAAAAYSAVVAIPYVGPFLAPAAAVVAYGAILAFGAQASAAGGYDIPSGTNPVTQLHQQEMVLPAKYANVIRGMAGAGGGSGGATMNVTAIDAASFAKYLNQNGSQVSQALRRLNSRFM
jgi:hypothetical protein